MEKRNRTTKIITSITGIFIGLVIAIFPLGYFFISHQYIVGSLETETRITADIITQVISANPKMWEFEEARLEELLLRSPSTQSGEIRRILKKNKIVCEILNPLKPPLMMRSHELMDSGVVVGKMEIYRSLYPLLTKSALILMVALSVGAGAFIIMRILPIRSLIRAEDALRMSEKEAKQLSQENAIMAEIGRIISSTLEIEKVYELFAKAVRKVIPFDRIAINIIYSERDAYASAYIMGKDVADHRPWDIVPLDGSLTEEVVRTRSSMSIQTDDKDEVIGRFPQLLPNFQAGLQSLIAVPLISKDQVIGVLHVQSAKQNTYTERDLRLAERVGNQIAGAIANAQLFIERKQTEEKYRTIVRTTMDGFWIVDMQGRFLDVNDAYCRMIGYSRDEMLTMSISDVEAEERQEETARHIQKIMEVGEDRFETRHKCKDGRIIDIEVSVNYMEISGGRMSVFLRDITERKRTEEAFRESEDRYRDLVEYSRYLICTHDLRGQILSVNQEGARLLGYDQRDLLNKNIRDLLALEVRDEFDTYLDTIQKQGAAKGFMVLLTATGGKRVWEYNNTLRTEGVTVPIVRAISHDVTERLLAEKAVTRLSQENATMAEIGRIISSTLNINEVYERFAEEVRKLISFDRISINVLNHEKRTFTIAYITGLDVDDRRMGDVIPLAATATEEVFRTRSSLLIQAEDLQEITSPFPGLLSSLQVGLLSTMSVPLISKDQVIGVLHVQSLKPNAYTELNLKLAERVGTQIAGAIANAQLFAERNQAEEALRESEKRFRELYDNAPVGYHEYDLEGRITRVNRTDLEMLGYTREEMIGLPIWKLNVEEETVREQVMAKLAGTLPPGKELERIYRKKDGTTLPVLIEDRLIRDEKGKIKGIRCTIQDITERKQIEEALQRSEEAAKRTARENAVVAKIGRIISSTLKIEEVYERFAEEVRRLIPFDRIMINAINPEDNTAIFTYVSGVDIEGRRVGDIIPLVGTITEECMRTQSSLLFQTEDEAEVAGRFPDLLSSTFRAGMRSMMSVPLISKEEVIGVLHFRSLKTKAYSELDIRLAESIGHQIAGAIANAQLFAERNQAEEALRKSEKRFRELYDNAPVGYHEYDKEGCITQVNRTELEMLGYTAEEMLGQPVWNFIVEKESQEKAKAKLAGDIPPGKAFERTYRKKDRTTLPALIEDRLLRDSKGRVTGIRSTIQDITERKRSEDALHTEKQRFQTLLENAPFGMVMIDKEGNFKYTNPKFVELFGYHLNDVPKGREWFKKAYPDPEYRHHVIETWINDSNIFTSGGKIPRIFTATCKDGSKKIVRFITVQLETGEYLMSCEDITLIQQAEKEKAALEEQLRQSQKIEAIGRLAGGIAHDFNNLLTVIKGYSRLSLIELKEGDPLRENIEEIQRASERATDLTRQLLAFSRRQILDFKVLNLNTLLRNLDKMLRRILGEDIELVTLLAEDLGKVKTDPGQIEQLIMNLSVNARDAMTSGGKLTIETANMELGEEYARAHISVTPGHYVMLSVSDTGAGMSPEIKENIFEPFFTTKEKGKGTGLGLSTVYGIVKQSGGNIWVYSEPGQGTTFKIYFPRVEEEERVLHHRETTGPLLQGKETILLVEDEASVRSFAARVLHGHGYTLLEAVNGDEALRLAQEHAGEEIHLLLTDVVMPKMGGKELADRLKILWPDIRVLFTSGYTDNAIVQHGVLNPGIHFLQKPFSPEALARKVREVLERE